MMSPIRLHSLTQVYLKTAQSSRERERERPICPKRSSLKHAQRSINNSPHLYKSTPVVSHFTARPNWTATRTYISFSISDQRHRHLGFCNRDGGVLQTVITRERPLLSHRKGQQVTKRKNRYGICPLCLRQRQSSQSASLFEIAKLIPPFFKLKNVWVTSKNGTSTSLRCQDPFGGEIIQKLSKHI